ncbi:MAG: type II toxin-antitoxin system VapC family toxin [Acidimicrobiaceae bacterium]|nr:type II toxin-antitoxin system VapC family toxin [Acidimicrobiaceae bacterium]MXW76919.1 type II toxin-antitoxin system VapC family toxin [Acidimicrobiaceae bacterium]MYA75932.1 type II toxin-antitoxin system VapC family toxin [Acidimicrobiaceae bacterium]MYC41606.1 type II toxin-antitoxin system VapC family toxin [Acidimicrobiaceae bacterium]MYD05582.1 type II toxin-antitoxin system VapC family toxin [Acidimicrobiaceae bacterium]
MNLCPTTCSTPLKEDDLAVLLDTQVFLWMNASPQRLSDAAKSMIVDPAQELLFSAVSSWEISIKHALGRLHLPEPPVVYVPSRIAGAALAAISIEHSHTLHAGSLPNHHRDPFDRLLIAQAQELDVPILTSDTLFDRYDVEVVRA